MKIIRSWVGKKESTNPTLKEKHNVRKIKKYLINKIKTKECKDEIINYNNDKKIF